MKQMIRWFLLMILIALWGGGVLLIGLAERALLKSTHERILVAMSAHRQHLQSLLADQAQDLQLFAIDAQQAAAEPRSPRVDASFLASHMPEVIGCVLLDAQGRLVAHMPDTRSPVSVHVPAGLTTVRFTDPVMDPHDASP